MADQAEEVNRLYHYIGLWCSSYKPHTKKKKKKRTKDKTITTAIYLEIPYTHFRGQILR